MDREMILKKLLDMGIGSLDANQWANIARARRPITVNPKANTVMVGKRAVLHTVAFSDALEIIGLLYLLASR